MLFHICSNTGRRPETRSDQTSLSFDGYSAREFQADPLVLKN